MALPMEVVLGNNHPDHAACIGSNEASDSTTPLPEANSNSMFGPCSVPLVSLSFFSFRRLDSAEPAILLGVVWVGLSGRYLRHRLQ